jgi:tetratricopeptide (TPR) repeat protein
VAALVVAVGLAACAPAVGGSGEAQDLVEAARAAAMRDDNDEAIRLYTAAIAMGNLSDSDQATAYLRRGRAHERKREFDAEIADCGAALRLKPDFDRGYICRAYAYRMEMRSDLAIADLDAAIGFHPDDAYAFEQRGAAYRAKHDYDRAIADYDEAVRLQPDYAEAFYYRGVTYLGRSEVEPALADVNAAIRLKPDLAEAYATRAVLSYAKEQHDAAMADFATAIRLKPDDPMAYGYRGERELCEGHLPEAASDFAQSNRLAPSDTYSVLLLHLARAKAGTDDAAEFSRNLAKVDRSTWPGPLLSLYRGEATPAETRTAITVNDAERRRNQECEADFFIGEYDLLRKDAPATQPLLRGAAENCPSFLRAEFAACAERDGRARGNDESLVK